MTSVVIFLYPGSPHQVQIPTSPRLPAPSPSPRGLHLFRSPPPSLPLTACIELALPCNLRTDYTCLVLTASLGLTLFISSRSGCDTSGPEP